MDDSGDRSTYQTGALRENHPGKGRYDLIATQALMRIAIWYERGAKKYKDRNWEKGMNFSRYADAAMRHLVKYIAGWDDEDHLAAVAWNVMALMHHEDSLPHLQDLPAWKGGVSSWVVSSPPIKPKVMIGILSAEEIKRQYSNER